MSSDHVRFLMVFILVYVMGTLAALVYADNNEADPHRRAAIVMFWPILLLAWLARNLYKSCAAGIGLLLEAIGYMDGK